MEMRDHNSFATLFVFCFVVCFSSDARYKRNEPRQVPKPTQNVTTKPQPSNQNTTKPETGGKKTTPQLATNVQDLNQQFWKAASTGDNTKLMALLSKGVNINVPDDDGHTALMLAAD